MLTYKKCLFFTAYLTGMLIILSIIADGSHLRGGIVEENKEQHDSKIIHSSVRLDCDAHRAFEMFTVNECLQSWLPELADVEPVVGGKFELFWDPENPEDNSTIGCKVTAVEQDRFIAFEWKGPVQFKHFMNDADPLTHVVVFFLPSGTTASPRTEVHLIHSGWRETEEWYEARLFFKRAWDRAFEKLKSVVNGQ